MPIEFARPETGTVTERLARNGIVVLPHLVEGETLAGMQRAFAHALGRLRINLCSWYEKSEVHRDMV